MRNSKKSSDLVEKDNANMRKSKKHDVNLQKNSTLYFQVGLILCLLATYGALEMSFTSSKDYVYATKETDDNVIYEVDPKIYKIIKDVKHEPVKEVVKPKPKNPDFEIVDDNKEIEKIEKKLVSIVVPPNKKVVLKASDPILEIEDPEDNKPVSIMTVQRVPVYSGCEKETTNNGRRKCMSQKLSKLMQRKFNTGIASDAGLTGKQKIYVSFKINKLGNVEIIETKADYKVLEKEANRVVGKIPKMEPGKNNNIPVAVSYMLPIQFNIQ